MNLDEAFFAVMQLYTDLDKLVRQDPEQEVQGTAESTVDAVVSACREYLPNHPIVSQIADILSPELIESGGPLRVADVLPLSGR